MNHPLPILVCILTLAGAGACGVSDKDSGGDAERYLAKPLALGKPQPDKIDGASDRTDWKVVELQDTGFLSLELSLDNPDAEVTLAVFDRFGKPVNRVSHRKGDGPVLKMTVEAGLGKYFVEVFAENRADATGYTISARVK